MLKKKKGKEYGAAFIAALALITVMIIGATVWSIHATNENVDQAVNRLSAFYMEELVGKREVVLRDSLDQNFEQVHRVISLLETADIRDQASLRRFLSHSKTLCGAKKLAIVDEDNTVYTAHSTFSDASRYSFLQQNFTDPQIITSNLYGAVKQVVVAVPVDNIRLQGKEIVACFMQLDIDDVVGSLTYEDTNDAGNTYIGLYYKNGENLTTSRFDDIEPGQNLLEYIRMTQLSDEQSADEIEQSFRQGEKGIVTVKSGGETKYIYYVPVEGTDWMLTVMIRDNTIEDQLEYTSGTMMRRNIIQLISTAVVIIAVFLVIGFLNKRNSDMRIRQQELEVRAKNEEELRAAYHAVETSRNELEQQLGVIGGMSNAFFAVYAARLSSRVFHRVKESPDAPHVPENLRRIDEALAALVPLAVHTEDQERMTAFVDCDTLADRLKDTNSIVMEYHSAQPFAEWCRASWIAASRDADGRAERVLFTAEDISAIVQEQKKYERELKSARDEAEKASRAKTAFLFNMSHDIRTPMNAILGYTDIGLAHAGDADRAADSFTKIKTAGGHLLSLINDILEMSRIESGKLELVEHGVDIRQAIENIDALGQALALPKSIDFQTVMGRIRTPYIYADELHINEVIINLISNAVKYTPNGGKVRYRIDQIGDVSDGKVTYRFEVTDTGIGMSEEFQTQLFEAFSREASSTVSKTEGAGLGLSIVKNIVEIAGGTITAHSVLHEGSTFIAEIPFRVMDEADIEKFTEENRQAGAGGTDVLLEGKKVLLVEDNEINREIATMILQDAGLAVEEAENGAVAVRILQDRGMNYYDFILMDIQMPEMDGYEAAKTIREMPEGNRAKIIALSANAFEEDRQKALSVGMNAHVAKPINVSELLGVMSALR